MREMLKRVVMLVNESRKRMEVFLFVAVSSFLGSLIIAILVILVSLFSFPYLVKNGKLIFAMVSKDITLENVRGVADGVSKLVWFDLKIEKVLEDLSKQKMIEVKGDLSLNEKLNRAEFVKMLVLINNIFPSLISNSNCFSDVKNEWFAAYVCYLKKNGLVKGNGEKFFPLNEISLKEALLLLSRFYKKDLVRAGVLNDSLEEWEGVKKMYKQQIGNVDFSKSLSREEGLKLIYWFKNF